MFQKSYPKISSGISWPLVAVSVFTVGVAVWAVYDSYRQSRAELVDIRVRSDVASDIPDFAEVSVIQERKDMFYDFLLPMIEAENERLTLMRDQLSQWQDTVDRGRELSPRGMARMTEWAQRYYVETEQSIQNVLDELWVKVDQLPPSLVVAQAANESAWGTSRFAREGNNLFGQWCFSPGCGLVPESRPEGESYEVRRFDDPLMSVRVFMQNLNRHTSYAGLRERRAELREQGERVTGVALAPHLLDYSTRREAYVDEIIGMINFNDLQDLDQ